MNKIKNHFKDGHQNTEHQEVIKFLLEQKLIKEKSIVNGDWLLSMYRDEIITLRLLVKKDRVISLNKVLLQIKKQRLVGRQRCTNFSLQIKGMMGLHATYLIFMDMILRDIFLSQSV